ncbi:hypothetical protein ACFL9U_16630 [Thermodesulfobacteriota bacterium]
MLKNYKDLKVVLSGGLSYVKTGKLAELIDKIAAVKKDAQGVDKIVIRKHLAS